MAHEDKFVQVDRLKTRYLEEGSGSAVILLHGASLGSSADVFTRNLSSLARAGLRVIAYDQPGFGLTDNPGDYSVAYRRRFIMMFRRWRRKGCQAHMAKIGRSPLPAAHDLRQKRPRQRL